MKIRSPRAHGALVVTCLLSLAAVPSLGASGASPPAPPAPVCAHRDPPAWVTSATHPNDGVPDPARRIVFGLQGRFDDILGQTVRLFAIDPDGSDLVQLLDCEVAQPRFSPDGSRSALSIIMDDGHLQVATVAADGSDLRILAAPFHAETPDWSPDGTWLIYSHSAQECPDPDCIIDDGVRESLWRMDIDGSDQRRVGKADHNDWEPRLSPDGREVVFTRVDAANDFWATSMFLDLATGDERAVTAGGRESEHPEWSPDGEWIIYGKLHGPDGGERKKRIERVPAHDATAAPEVLFEGGINYMPTYAPDGSRIAFGCSGNLCTMAADGSDLVKLVSAEDRGIFSDIAWGRTPPAPA